MKKTELTKQILKYIIKLNPQFGMSDSQINESISAQAKDIEKADWLVHVATGHQDLLDFVRDAHVKQHIKDRLLMKGILPVIKEINIFSLDSDTVSMYKTNYPQHGMLLLLATLRDIEYSIYQKAKDDGNDMTRMCDILVEDLIDRYVNMTVDCTLDKGNRYYPFPPQGGLAPEGGCG